MNTNSPVKSSGQAHPGSAASILRHDLPASVVVFLVAVPLSLGIALASGAPMMAGLIAAAVGGIVVGLLSGAPLQVSGPAAGLTVMVFGFIEEWGFATTCAVTVGAGALQAALGRLGVARVTLAISPAVIHGMLAGIGILITLGQLHVVLGGTPQSDAIANIRDLPGQLADLHGAATTIGLATIAILVGWQFLPWKGARRVPAPLVAITAVTVVASVTAMQLPRITLSGSLTESIQLPSITPGIGIGTLALGAIALAVVASAESLLCAVATDKLHDGKRADLNKELFAQGVGNMTSGLIGGLPVTGVIVRSTANVSSGGRSRMSPVFHGLWIVAVILWLQDTLQMIPLAALAGLLVFVGVKLVNLNHIRNLQAHGEILVYGATVGGVVFLGLLQGIGLGIAVAIARVLWRFTHVEVDIDASGDPVVVNVSGPLIFAGVPKLSSALSRVPRGSNVVLRVHSDLLDHAGFEALEVFRENHERTGGHVSVAKLPVTMHQDEEEPTSPAPPAETGDPVPDDEPPILSGPQQAVPESS